MHANKSCNISWLWNISYSFEVFWTWLFRVSMEVIVDVDLPWKSSRLITLNNPKWKYVIHTTLTILYTRTWNPSLVCCLRHKFHKLFNSINIFPLYHFLIHRTLIHCYRIKSFTIYTCSVISWMHTPKVSLCFN